MMAGTVYSDSSVSIPKCMTVIPASEIVDIAVEDGWAASSWITATRVALIGVFALAAEKKVDAKKYPEAHEFVKRAQAPSPRAKKHLLSRSRRRIPPPRRRPRRLLPM